MLSAGAGVAMGLVDASDDATNYVGFVWRLISPNGETGFLPSTLAYSRIGLAWTPFNLASVVPGTSDNTDLPDYTYAHIYNTWPSPAAGAAACNTACRNDSDSCLAWAYVSPSAGLGAERCALKREKSPVHFHAPGPRGGFGNHGGRQSCCTRASPC